MSFEAGRPVEVGTWGVPAYVRAESGRILYRLGKGAGRWTSATPRRELLDRFCALAVASEEAIGAFAREWGILGLCEHDLSPDHKDVASVEGTLPIPLPCLPRIAQRGPRRHSGELPALTLWEPIELWKSLALKASALIRLAAVLREANPKPRSASDWVAVGGRLDARLRAERVTMRGWRFPNANLERQDVGSQVSAWLKLAGVRPIVSWDGERPRLTLTSVTRWAPHGSLLGALGVQLSAAVVGRGGFAVCSECGEFYRPMRAPKAGQRAFCPRCRRDGAPHRAAQRDHQSRKRAERVRAAR